MKNNSFQPTAPEIVLPLEGLTELWNASFFQGLQIILTHRHLREKSVAGPTDLKYSGHMYLLVVEKANLV